MESTEVFCATNFNGFKFHCGKVICQRVRRKYKQVRVYQIHLIFRLISFSYLENVNVYMSSNAINFEGVTFVTAALPTLPSRLEWINVVDV